MAHNPKIVNKAGDIVQILNEVEIVGDNISLSASQITASSIVTVNLTGSSFDITENKVGLTNIKRNSRTVSSNTTLTSNDQIVFVNAQTSARTITLPPLYEVSGGQEYLIRKIDSSANAVNIVSQVPFINFITSASSNLIITGSSGKFAKNGTTIIAGNHIYVSGASGWTFSQMLTGSKADIVTPSTYDGAVSINFSGTRAVIGNDVGSNNGTTWPGLAYIFRSASSGWVEEKILLGSKATTSGERFGHSIDMNDAGDCVIVGAYMDNNNSAIGQTGIAYIFNSSSSGWTERKILTGSLAIHGSEWFGRSVCLNASGSRAAVGAPYDDLITGSYNGLVYIFNSSSSGWSQEAIIKPSTATLYFGGKVAMNGTGDIIAARDESTDKVYIFKSSSSGWSEISTMSGAIFNSNISINTVGNIVSSGGRTYISSSLGFKQASNYGGGFLNSQGNTVFTFDSSKVLFYTLSGSAIDNLISASLTTGSNTISIVADSDNNWRII